MAIPTSLQTVVPYLIVNNALEFIDFLQNLFNAEITNKLMHDATTLRHAEVKIGNASIMFGSASKEWKPLNASLFIYVDDADSCYAKAITLGCTTIMELSNQDYGRTCGVQDTFGNIWWITSI